MASPDEEDGRQGVALRRLLWSPSSDDDESAQAIQELYEKSIEPVCLKLLGREPSDALEMSRALNRADDLTATELLAALWAIAALRSSEDGGALDADGVSRADCGLHYLEFLGNGLAWVEEVYEMCADENPGLRDQILRAGARALELVGGRLPELLEPDTRRLAPLHQLMSSAVAELRELAPESLGQMASASLLPPLLLALRAVSDSPVVILGETGTGKEDSARAIHDLSRRHAKKFRAINVGSMPSDTMAESALFGHVKGAFTDARQDRTGAFQEADKGTLFLDEVGDVSLGVQIKLLRALDAFGQRVRPVGSDSEVDVDVRLIFATNRDLERLVTEKRMRQDFYFRLQNATRIALVPLRSRSDEDFQAVWNQTVQRFGTNLELEDFELRPAALQRMRRDGSGQQRAWLGNVRELQRLARDFLDFNAGKDFPSSVVQFLEHQADEASPDVRAPELPGPDDAEFDLAVHHASLVVREVGLEMFEERFGRAILEAFLRDNDDSGAKAAAALKLRSPAFYSRCRRAAIPVRKPKA